MEKAISTINYLPSTKDDINTYVNKAIEEILSGSEDALKIAIQLKSMEEIVKKIRDNKEVKDFIIDEILKHGKSVEAFNAKLEAVEAGVKYDYSTCNSSEWNDLDLQIKQLTSKKKGIEGYLKGLTDITPDTNTGEMINPPVKTSSSTFKVTMK